MSSDKAPAAVGAFGRFDMVVVGGGPAGTACALTARRAGLRVALIERAGFPRHKVCGDCLNPAAWPLLEELGVADRMRQAEHVRLRAVAFASSMEKPVTVPIPMEVEKIAITRALFDAILMDEARARGVQAHFEDPVTGVEDAPNDLWRLKLASGASVIAPYVVGADGRHSLVARTLGFTSKILTKRVGLQTHVPLSRNDAPVVAMHFLPQGYAGWAPVSASVANLCLAGSPAFLPALKAWARERFELAEEPDWRTMAPLERRDHPLMPRPGVLLAGDAARVVEPFTGEGIYYGLATGMAAGKCVAEAFASGDRVTLGRRYGEAHRDIYAGRLWINRFARLAATRPWLGAGMVTWSRRNPSMIRLLTRKVIG